MCYLPLRIIMQLLQHQHMPICTTYASSKVASHCNFDMCSDISHPFHETLSVNRWYQNIVNLVQSAKTTFLMKIRTTKSSKKAFLLTSRNRLQFTFFSIPSPSMLPSVADPLINCVTTSLTINHAQGSEPLSSLCMIVGLVVNFSFW